MNVIGVASACRLSGACNIRTALDVPCVAPVARPFDQKEVDMAERERIDPGNDPRYVRRDDDGRFEEVEDVGRSSAADQRTPDAGPTRKGQGDRGDREAERD